jgi:ABC-type Fe3+/spermidine/putrescine transport system ATPase subunit
MGYRNVLELDVAGRDGDRVVLASPDFRLAGTQKQPVAAKRAAVAIRPEEIVVVDHADAANTIAGRVDNVEYGGRDALLDVVTPSGIMLHVRGPVDVKRGDDVRVHVPAERALVYPAEA